MDLELTTKFSSEQPYILHLKREVLFRVREDGHLSATRGDSVTNFYTRIAKRLVIKDEN